MVLCRRGGVLCERVRRGVPRGSPQENRRVSAKRSNPLAAKEVACFPIRTPEFKPSFRGLASPVSVLHDHPYSQLARKAWKKQIPAKMSKCGWNPTHFDLTPEDIVCRRNGVAKNFERRAVVETDFLLRSNNHGGGRRAKYLANLRINNGLEKTLVVKPKKKTSRQRNRKRPKLKPKRSREDLRSPTESSSFSYTPLSSPLGRQDMSPSSLLAHAQNCSVGLTPANTVGICSPLHVSSQVEYSESVSSSGGLSSSRASSLSPAHQVVRPFSISLQRISPALLPHSISTIALE